MKKIMVIDDDKNIVYALTIRCKSQGYQVISAYDPVQGLTKILENKPDLILLDISMPAGGGLLMAERVLQHPKIGPTPIIIISAANNPEFRAQALNLGIEHFFEKPLDIFRLMQTVKMCLEEAA